MASHIALAANLEALVKLWIHDVTKTCGHPDALDGGDRIVIRWPRPYVPPGEDPETYTHRNRTYRREQPFFSYKKGLMKSLEGPEWERIKFWYYCDNDFGNTLRLYDERHFKTPGNDGRYLELENSGPDGPYPDRVVFRAENIGREKQPLKLTLRSRFTGLWPASSAPAGSLPAEETPAPATPVATPAGAAEPTGQGALNLEGVSLDDIPSLLRRLPVGLAVSRTVDVMGMCEQFLAKRHHYFQHPARNNMPGNSPPPDCSKCSRRPCGIRGM